MSSKMNQLFSVPASIPQDLLLIRDLLGPQTDTKPEPPRPITEDDCIDSTDSESNASEEEIAACLTTLDHDDDNKPDLISDPPASNSSDSYSESDFSGHDATNDVSLVSQDDNDEDEEFQPPAVNASYFQTKNEIMNVKITIPDIEEVGAHEALEKVGEIMTVMENLVIVKGLISEVANRGNERALDSDTLLVFDDRKVLGYIYETFGPTSQPFYQVRFDESYPLNPERTRVAREVFHIPSRSNFVFVDQIKNLKGSDASNVHDEEPAEHELDFSDDEAEAAFRSNLKKKRINSRANSTTLQAPSQMRDQDLDRTYIMSRNPYDEHGPYDVDYLAPPSRPPPVPYDDDPYADNYTPAELIAAPEVEDSRGRDPHGNRKTKLSTRGRRGRERGRGRGRDNDKRAYDERRTNYQPEYSQDGSDFYTSFQQYPLPPATSTPYATTGRRYPTSTDFSSQHGLNQPINPIWNSANAQTHQFGPMQFPMQSFSPFVQPHINPRFASTFGLNLGYMSPQSQPSPGYPPFGAGNSATNPDFHHHDRES